MGERGQFGIGLKGIKHSLRTHQITEFDRVVAEIGADIQNGHSRLGIGAQNVVDEIFPSAAQNDPTRELSPEISSKNG